MILRDKRNKITSQSLLLLGILLFVFVIPLIHKTFLFEFLSPLSYSIICLSILSILEKKDDQNRYLLMVLVIISIASLWLMYFTQLSIFNFLSFILSIIVFVWASAVMIKQIVKSKEVTAKVVLEVINGYLLLGVMYTFSITLIWRIDPNSMNIDQPKLLDFVYYSFISLTSIGYGDVLPVSDLAKMTSVFFGLAGQLYLTIIVALIIGKFINFKESSK